MAFRNEPFPECLSQGTTMEPLWLVDVARNQTKQEYRFLRSDQAIYAFSAAINVRTLDALMGHTNHWHNMHGKEHSFPFRYPHDYKSCLPGPDHIPAQNDVLLGTGNGSNLVFPVRKAFVFGAYTYYHDGILAKASTLLVEVNGVLKTSGVHYNYDATTGIITFTGGNAPGNGLLVKAGFEFYFKVRYDMDSIKAVAAAHNAGSVPTIPLLEVL
jgi:uncharacterized protein (TIGR02217 family)